MWTALQKANWPFTDARRKPMRRRSRRIPKFRHLTVCSWRRWELWRIRLWRCFYEIWNVHGHCCMEIDANIKRKLEYHDGEVSNIRESVGKCLIITRGGRGVIIYQSGLAHIPLPEA